MVAQKEKKKKFKEITVFGCPKYLNYSINYYTIILIS